MRLNDIKQEAKERFQKYLRRSSDVLRWIVAAILVGLTVGAVAAAFAKTLIEVTNFRVSHSYLVYALPVGGMIITLYYHILLKGEKDGGTNKVIEAIRTDKGMEGRYVPLIFLSTALTHLVGGSAGREGAALQIGGAMGSKIGKLLKLNLTDRQTLIMCGMSASFSALFGTPMAASIFSIELASVGIMHYAALVPCVIASLIASFVSHSFGVTHTEYLVGEIPAFGFMSGAKIILLALLVGYLSIIFCVVLHNSSKLANTYIKNPYIKGLILGSAVLILTFLVGDMTYNGAGNDVIARAFVANAPWYQWALKLIFTAITLAAGYKGGEIVPTLFVGASFGSFMAQVLNLPVGLCAAVAMGALFCGVTNCPLSSLLICFELFGYEAMPYYLLAVSISYMVSGYYGLYSSQKIVYSKYKSNYIDRRVS